MRNEIPVETLIKHKEYFDQKLVDTYLDLMKKHDSLFLEVKSLRSVIASKDVQLAKDKIAISDLEDLLKELEEEISDLRNDIFDTKEEIVRVNIKSDEKDETIRNQREIIDNQNNEIEELKRKLKKYQCKDSSNTNMPSSNNPFESHKKSHPTSLREATTRKRGGQKGHKFNHSVLKSNSDNIRIRTVKKAPTGAECVKDENGNVQYYRVQQMDASFQTAITETRYYIDEVNGEDLLPEEEKLYRVNAFSYSSQFKSIALYLNHRGAIALERECKMLNELSNGAINVRPSTITNWRKEFAEDGHEYVSYILNEMLKSYVLHVDETGYKTNGNLSWIHVMCSKEFAYYIMADKRKDTEVGPLALLQNFENVLMHDHYKSYYTLLKAIHAECNAHVQRALKAGLDFDGIKECKDLIEHMQSGLRRKNELIEQGKDGMSKEEYDTFRRKYLDLCRNIQTSYMEAHPEVKQHSKYEPDAIKVARRMEDYVDQHLLFLKDFNVPYTNNDCEKSARYCKAFKKISGQVYSEETGAIFCKLLTIMQTAIKQNDNGYETIKNILETGWPHRENLNQKEAN